MPSRICSVPLDWTIETYRSHTCSDGSHFHLSHSQLNEHLKKNIVVYLQRSTTRREKDVVKVEILPVANTAWAGRPSKRRIAGEEINHGLSFRVGAYLARGVRERKSWAIVMLSHITMRPERESAA